MANLVPRPRLLTHVDIYDDFPVRTSFCTFYQRYPKDNVLADDNTRWCPELRELIWYTDGDYDFCERILFTPRQKTDQEFYGKFTLSSIFQLPPPSLQVRLILNQELILQLRNHMSLMQNRQPLQMLAVVYLLYH